MKTPLRVLFLGASYGSLLATKLAAAGHRATLVCLPAERELINREGTVIRLPVRELNRSIELRSQALPGVVDASSGEDAVVENYDLIVLAMQEPQYATAGVSALWSECTT